MTVSLVILAVLVNGAGFRAMRAHYESRDRERLVALLGAFEYLYPQGDSK